MDINIKSLYGYSEELTELICPLESAIFTEPYTKDKIRRESSAKHNLIALFACHNGEAVGFKIGYEMTSRIFYSWMGGVLEHYRGNGIAQQLMAEQHKIARQQQYKIVRTYTENRFRNMLLLNIRSGFDVVGVMNDPNKLKSVIVLDKQL